jgi:hypothetical protein
MNQCKRNPNFVWVIYVGSGKEENYKSGKILLVFYIGHSNPAPVKDA